MRRFLSFIILIFIILTNGQAARVITSFDIARWYLDSDLVLICSVNKIDTIMISEHDSIIEDGYHLRYKTIREKYIVSTDSIIKGDKVIAREIDSVFTPLFSTQAIQEKKEFNGFDIKGDSTFLNYIQIFRKLDDNSYFRVKSLLNKYLIILQKTEIGYEINYVNYCDSWLLDLIKEVKLKGENFFPLPDTNE